LLTFVQNFKEKKQVQDYADILFRSPKTLSNLFASCGLPSPLKVIHERIEAGAALAIVMTVGTLSFLVATPEVWVPDLGSVEHGLPFTAYWHFGWIKFAYLLKIDEYCARNFI